MGPPEGSQQPSPAVTPKRYPTRVRVSAVQDVQSRAGKDSPKLREQLSSNSSSNGRARRVRGSASPSVGGENMKEEEKLTGKRRKMEEEHVDDQVIKKEDVDFGEVSINKEDDGEIPVNREPRNSIVVMNNRSEELVTRRKVRVALFMFQMIYRKLLQKEESKLKQPRHGLNTVFTAYRLFREANNVLDPEKHVGSVPGVEVGDEFQFRVELLLANVHRQIPGSIDFANINGQSLAVSIVSCGSYANYLKTSDVLVFNGTGSPTEHQKLLHGNLALKNSIDARTPVRVIRGINGKKKSVRYIYDGLFIVENHWRRKGKNDYYVFKFRLRRMPGQPELAIKKLELQRSRTLSGLCIEDISKGEEKIPISVVNTMDNELPMPFIYTTKLIYPSKYQPTSSSGCDCINGCSDSEKCACAVKNGGEIPFNYNGALVEAKPLVYECGPNCKCPSSCHNRVSQHGIKFPLEIFKTESMGWGVRCLTSIPSGSFICEYIGELLKDEEAQKRNSDDYLFAIGNNYYDESLWEGLSTFIPDLQKNNDHDIVEDGGFTLDASQYGNVGKYINHSCTPNLYAQNLLYDHNDKRMPHVMLFATENIPPLQELTYHYNYNIDGVHDADGNIRKKDCYCGSIECTGRLY